MKPNYLILYKEHKWLMNILRIYFKTNQLNFKPQSEIIIRYEYFDLNIMKPKKGEFLKGKRFWGAIIQKDLHLDNKYIQEIIRPLIHSPFNHAHIIFR